MKFQLIAGLLGGCLLWHGFEGSEALRASHEHNPFTLKRSPYGEIIGAAMQDPVHLISHGGVGHEHMKSGESSGGRVEEPWLLRRKKALLAMEAEVRQNNFPGQRSRRTGLYEGQLIREMMAEAFAMDPTNYGNYNIVGSHSKGSGGLAGLEKVSYIALEATEGRNWDPEDALTAASAAENLLIFRIREYGFDDREERIKDYKLFAQKVKNFERVFDKAVADKRIYHFKEQKIQDMVTRYTYFDYTLRKYAEKLGIQSNSISQDRVQKAATGKAN